MLFISSIITFCLLIGNISLTDTNFDFPQKDTLIVSRTTNLLVEEGIGSFIKKIKKGEPVSLLKEGTWDYNRRTFSPWIKIQHQSDTGWIFSGNTDYNHGYVKPKSIVIKGNNIWVRNQPRTGKVVLQLNDGTVCNFISRGPGDYINNTFDYWLNIEYKGDTAWVFGSQTDLKVENDFSAIPYRTIWTNLIEYNKKFAIDKKNNWDSYVDEITRMDMDLWFEIQFYTSGASFRRRVGEGGAETIIVKPVFTSPEYTLFSIEKMGGAATAWERMYYSILSNQDEIILKAENINKKKDIEFNFWVPGNIVDYKLINGNLYILTIDKLSIYEGYSYLNNDRFNIKTKKLVRMQLDSAYRSNPNEMDRFEYFPPNKLIVRDSEENESIETTKTINFDTQEGYNLR